MFKIVAALVPHSHFGGEKQRIAVARVCYHSPVFALLDEATSAVSVDVESDLYRHMKSQGISLITVSHRMHLLKHHEFVLKFNGHGTWSFDRIDLAEIPRYQSYSNFLKLGGA
ncbi:ABC transporter, ATP-binding domain-containing protein [Cardiosporidium cionae]|uniref:ABC transporter, ATP-binding domain-containing protein n=1 Tax=Cardiosporidium cionae TaxID=476202 RepID=A0ABQ7J5J2_9APIC|nr:ABC transporter, ATP-binding domain-containing protein [Cardiosporidium cionae]|eukprot:KAF8819247.1 ABC transporter, ATP-binding domain-containing protein [Cardiosporidium cionae]